MKSFALASQDPVKLKLKPHICVLSSSDAACDNRFVAEWEVTNNQQLSLCLYQEKNEQALACWTNSTLGRAEVSLVLKQTTAFELRNQVDQTLLAREFYKVMYAQKNNSFSRRNPWSFF